MQTSWGPQSAALLMRRAWQPCSWPKPQQLRQQLRSAPQQSWWQRCCHTTCSKALLSDKWGRLDRHQATSWQPPINSCVITGTALQTRPFAGHTMETAPGLAAVAADRRQEGAALEKAGQAGAALRYRAQPPVCVLLTCCPRQFDSFVLHIKHDATCTTAVVTRYAMPPKTSMSWAGCVQPCTNWRWGAWPRMQSMTMWTWPSGWCRPAPSPQPPSWSMVRAEAPVRHKTLAATCTMLAMCGLQSGLPIVEGAHASCRRPCCCADMPPCASQRRRSCCLTQPRACQA